MTLYRVQKPISETHLWHKWEGLKVPNAAEPWRRDDVMRCGYVFPDTLAVWQDTTEPTRRRCLNCWPEDRDQRVETVANLLMDMRMDGPKFRPPTALTYQEAMRDYARTIVKALE